MLISESESFVNITNTEYAMCLRAELAICLIIFIISPVLFWINKGFVIVFSTSDGELATTSGNFMELV